MDDNLKQIKKLAREILITGVLFIIIGLGYVVLGSQYLFSFAVVLFGALFVYFSTNIKKNRPHIKSDLSNVLSLAAVLFIVLGVNGNFEGNILIWLILILISVKTYNFQKKIK